MTVTQVDVAKDAGVSWRTVQRVVNDPGLVDEATRANVNESIERLGYKVPEVRRGRKPSAVPLVHPVSLRVDERQETELARRGGVLTETHGPKTRGWDSEIIRLALDWAFNPPEGVAPMPEDYLGFGDRVTQV